MTNIKIKILGKAELAYTDTTNYRHCSIFQKISNKIENKN